MSSQNTYPPGRAPQRSSVPTAPSPQQWYPRRYNWGWTHIRRRNKEWDFLGKEPDERVVRLVRRHWLFLIRPALPLIVALVLFALSSWIYIALPGLHSIWPFLELIAVLLVVATAVWFIYRDVVIWWLDIDIITNKRIINWRGGFLHPSRKETPIEKVQQVALIQTTATQFFLDYADLLVYVVGGSLSLKDVPHPRVIKDAIQQVIEEFKAKKPPKEKPPGVPDPKINALLEELGMPKPIPKLPDADENYPPLHQDRRLGPRRVFGGPLNIQLDVHYTWGETTVMYIQKSIYVLLVKLIVPVLALIITVPLALYVPTTPIALSPIMSFWWLIMSLLILGLLIAMLIIYINYVADVYILTSNRIIDVERQYFFLYEERTVTEYKNIRDIKVEMPNALGFLFDIGDVHIETPGSTPNIVFKSILHPFFIQDKIYELKGYKEKEDSIKKDNERREELHLWFGKVIGTLERTPELKGAPNLKNLELIEAMALAEEFGFQVVVSDEDSSNPDISPGLIIHQSPPPGTVINPGGEIQVVLSK